MGSKQGLFFNQTGVINTNELLPTVKPEGGATGLRYK